MITSVHNPMVKDARALKDGRIRRALSLYLVEGPHMLEEALKSGAPIARCFCDSARVPAALTERVRGAGAELIEVAPHVLDALSGAPSPQGIVAVMRMREATLPERGRFLALDGVQDPGNMGAMLRSIEAAGFGGMIAGEGCADPFAPKAAQASMGSLFRVPVMSAASLYNTLLGYRDAGFALYAAAQEGQNVYTIDAVPEACVLVVGAEGQGIRPDIIALAHRLSLPMRGAVESLNAAVAASVLMYEMTAGKGLDNNGAEP